MAIKPKAFHRAHGEEEEKLMNIVVIQEDSKTGNSYESRVGNKTVPGKVNTKAWKSGPKVRKRKKKDKRRISRRGWKRHQKIREKMENWGPR